MPIAIPEIQMKQLSDRIEIVDVTGLWPNFLNGWLYTPGDPAIDIDSITAVTVTIVGHEYSQNFSLDMDESYVQPLPIMELSDLPVRLDDGLYDVTFSYSGVTDPDCIKDFEACFLVTNTVRACINSIRNSIVNDCTAEKKAETEQRFFELSAELFGIASSVNNQLLTDKEEVQRLLIALLAKCNSTDCGCNS